MNKVTIKVFFSTFFIITIASFIPNIISYFYTGKFIDENSADRPYIFIMIFVILILILVFNFIMNKIVYKRIKLLKKATIEVMQGNYEVEINEDGKDEITDVIRNFNIMVKELRLNEYQNKEFVTNFSHELKTPLSAIKGYSDLLMSPNISKEEHLEYLTIISNESKRLSELSRDMLLISLVDSKKILSKNDSFNIAEQVRNIIQLMQLSWELKEIQFNVSLPDKTIVSNKELLYQVWMNLLSNAINFAPIKSEININLKFTENELIFEISNYGLIDKNEIDEIFNLFFVSEKSRLKISSGVGLTLAKKIVNKLNGNISVVSLNSITMFKVVLPINN